MLIGRNFSPALSVYESYTLVMCPLSDLHAHTQDAADVQMMECNKSVNLKPSEIKYDVLILLRLLVQMKTNSYYKTTTKSTLVDFSSMQRVKHFAHFLVTMATTSFSPCSSVLLLHLHYSKRFMMSQLNSWSRNVFVYLRGQKVHSLN